MLFSQDAIAELEARLTAGSGGPISINADLDPLDLVRGAAPTVSHASYYASPDGPTIGGIGSAIRVTGSGTGRLAALDGAIVEMDTDLPIMVGFAFDAAGSPTAEWSRFPAATAVVPEVLAVRSDGTTVVTLTPRQGSDGRHLVELLAGLGAPTTLQPVGDVIHGIEARPSPDEWRGIVGDAAAMIAAGALTKVVLARTVVVRSGRVIPAFDLVARLADQHPGCRVFGWQEGGDTFIGASPELLVSRAGHTVRSEPLAGSAARGADPEQDQRLGDALLSSPKDRSEHAVTVDDAVARLAPLATELAYPSTPHLQRFSTVQHLATSISGTTDRRLLDLAEALHPTPAVGGFPREAATGLIAKVEGIDRGWYAGGIGWASADGDGEIAVALRCALVSHERATLFAGGGIVAGSDPAAELEETRLKLRPMLDLLTGA